MQGVQNIPGLFSGSVLCMSHRLHTRLKPPSTRSSPGNKAQNLVCHSSSAVIMWKKISAKVSKPLFLQQKALSKVPSQESFVWCLTALHPRPGTPLPTVLGPHSGACLPTPHCPRSTARLCISAFFVVGWNGNSSHRLVILPSLSVLSLHILTAEVLEIKEHKTSYTRVPS